MVWAKYEISPLFALDSRPVGYEFRSGDIPGWGSDLGGRLRLSRQECADECSKNQDCLSFEHSDTKQLCNLNRIAEPTQVLFEDFAFCVKQKSIKFFLVIHCHFYTFTLVTVNFR